MASVTLERVSKRYDNGIAVVDDLSLTIRNKEFVVLVGPSGCGKSTTLRMIAGLEDISEGNIYIEDKLVNDVPPKDRDIAMVFQNYALYPHMTVFENLAFGLKMRKYSTAEISQRVSDAADILGIRDLLERKPKALSGGQRQRVALGRAIVRRPKVFLFDEPLSNLDANLRVQMRTEISRLHRRLETTMIYVTHDQVEAMSMGDRIVVMNKGIVQQVDSPLTIYNSPANQFVAGFIGSPTMNFIPGTISNTGALTFQSETRALTLPLPIEHAARYQQHIGKEIILGIRPEHIAAHPTSPTMTSIKVFVEVTEPVGNEIFIYFRFPNQKEQYVSRIPSDLQPVAGSEFALHLDASKLHYFTKPGGESL